MADNAEPAILPVDPVGPIYCSAWMRGGASRPGSWSRFASKFWRSSLAINLGEVKIPSNPDLLARLNRPGFIGVLAPPFEGGTADAAVSSPWEMLAMGPPL